MDLKVIGAGFGRTGTSSLKQALTQLGIGEVYHMFELYKRPEHGKLWCMEQPPWDEIFRGYGAALDWPTAYFYAELARLNPEAKVVLTVRDAENWYDSAHATIWQRHVTRVAQGESRIMSDVIVWDRTFNGRFGDRDYAIGVYNRHIAEVRRTIDKDRLLEYNVGDGWGPLCDFLGLPVPDTPFPNINTRGTFADRVAQARSKHPPNPRDQ